MNLADGSKGRPTRDRSTKLRRRRSRSWVRRLLAWVLLRAVLVFVVVFFLLPGALLVVYRLPFVHPVSTPMIADRVTGKPYARQWVPLDDIAPVLVYSVMMSEDARFCTHHGVDWSALNTVIDKAVDGDVTRGASTIPMQTVKNLFLWQSRSYVRKAVEIPLAYAADFILGRRRLIEIYLNIAQWGPDFYGIEAAAQRYFHRKASALTAWQAALLAVTLPNPDLRDPAKPNAGLVRLARIIRERARTAGPYVGCVK